MGFLHVGPLYSLIFLEMQLREAHCMCKNSDMTLHSVTRVTEVKTWRKPCTVIKLIALTNSLLFELQRFLALELQIVARMVPGVGLSNKAVPLG